MRYLFYISKAYSIPIIKPLVTTLESCGKEYGFYISQNVENNFPQKWDKKRKIKGNDIIDFFHASAALPYCEAFFTDNPLKNILKSGNFNSAHQFSCEIFSGEDGVLNYLNEIEQSHLTSK